MTVAVMQPPQRKGNTEQILDAIGKGLMIAQAYYGLKTDMAKFDDYKANQDTARKKLEADTANTAAQTDYYNAQAEKARREPSETKMSYTEAYDPVRKANVLVPNNQKMPEGYLAPKKEAAPLTPEQQLALGERQRRIKDEERSKFVPGLGQADTIDDAKKIKEALDAFQNVKANVSNMRALRDKYGSEVLDRDAVATGQNLATDTQLQMKTIYGLGQISAGDAAMLNRIVPEDPLATDFTGKTYAKLRTLEQTAEQKLKTLLKNRGFDDKLVEAYIAHTNEVHRLPGRSDGGTAIAAPPGGGMIFVSNGKETLKIPASDVDAAKRDGYQPIAGGR